MAETMINTVQSSFLTRISHQKPTTAADLLARLGRIPCGLVNVVPATPSSPLVRAPRFCDTSTPSLL